LAGNLIKFGQRVRNTRLDVVEFETSPSPCVTVLAVHDDFAFLLALAVELVRNRIHLIPARSVRDVERLLSELDLQPDWLILNCEIQGVCALAEESLKQWPTVRVIAIVSEGQPRLKCRRLAVATIENSAPPAVDRWVSILRTLTREYDSVLQ
jgi:hypothetical protein